MHKDISELEEVGTPVESSGAEMGGTSDIPDFGSGFSDAPTDA